MWQRLTEKQKREIEISEITYFKKTRLKKSLLFFLIVFGLLMALEVTGAICCGIGHGGKLDPMPSSPIEWKELPIYLPKFLMRASFLGLIVFLVSYRFGHLKNETRTLICDKCFKTRNYKNNIICECGGNLDLLSNYKWIEEPTEEKTD